MDILILKKKSDENNLWMGFNPTHKWVILDRNLPGNKVSYGGDLFFIKCSDWSLYKDSSSNWEPPNYKWIVRYINSLSNDKQKEIQEETLNKKTPETFVLRVLILFLFLLITTSLFASTATSTNNPSTSFALIIIFVVNCSFTFPTMTYSSSAHDCLHN